MFSCWLIISYRQTICTVWNRKKSSRISWCNKDVNFMSHGFLLWLAITTRGCRLGAWVSARIWKMSSYAKSGTEVHTNAAKSIRMQAKCIFSYIVLCACLQWSLRLPQSVDQLWRRFLFCLQPAGLAIAAKYFAASCFPCKILLSLQSTAWTQRFSKRLLQEVHYRLWLFVH